MKKINFIGLFLILSIQINAQTPTHTGDTEIRNGRLAVNYTSPSEMSAAQLDVLSGDFGNQGIGGLNAGDVHVRGFWGVVIDKNGGNYGESTLYSNGVQPAGGSFAVRTRTTSTTFRTDFIIRNNGYVGIADMNPNERLVVDGNIKLNQSGNKIYWDWADRTIEQYSSGGNSRMIRFRNSMNSSNPDGGFDFATHDGVSVLRINQQRVGIGTTNLDPNNKLSVNGSIRSKEVKVEASWPDFVFESDYELRTLEEVEKHITENGHLPEIPSEAEVSRNGINLGEMNSKLLLKIEELTLYLIEQNKQLKSQSEIITQLQEEVSALKNK